jgi:hypothetical protein
MNFLIRDKGVDITKPHIVKRSSDGKYAIRKQGGGPGEFSYAEIRGTFHSSRLDKIDAVIGVTEWYPSKKALMYGALPVSTTIECWTNNLRGLRKILNYTEEVIEGVRK